MLLKGAVCLSLVFMAGWSVNAYSQIPGDSANTGISGLSIPKPGINLKKMSLLDPERFTMHSQYMMNFSSTGGNGGVMGMYLNTMEYRFNAPVVMRLQVAYQSQTGMLFGNKDNYNGFSKMDQGRLFVPSFDIIYKPFKNTTIGFSYRDMSSMSMYNPYGYGYGYGYSRRYNPFGYSPYMRY